MNMNIKTSIGFEIYSTMEKISSKKVDAVQKGKGVRG